MVEGMGWLLIGIISIALITQYVYGWYLTLTQGEEDHSHLLLLILPAVFIFLLGIVHLIKSSQ